MLRRVSATRVRKPAGRYHHGALREALVEAARRLLASGAPLPGLREVARAAGVTHAAAYRHFESRAALLAEVARRGFLRLEARLREAGAAAEGAAGLEAAAEAYVALAAEDPGAFGVMFAAELKPFTAHPGLAEAADAALAVLVGLAERGVADGSLQPLPPREVALATWAAVHGLATLARDRQLEGRFDLDLPGAAAAARRLLAMLLAGVRAAPPARPAAG